MAWAYGSVMTNGQIVSGVQSVPMFRLPLMISAQRKFSYGAAMLNFAVTYSTGGPTAAGAGEAAGGDEWGLGMRGMFGMPPKARCQKGRRGGL